MAVSEPARRRIVALLVAAIAALIVRIVALQFGASASVARGLYAVAVVCLIGGVLVLFRESRS
jgi:type IV secretory pathway protease TraF